MKSPLGIALAAVALAIAAGAVLGVKSGALDRVRDLAHYRRLRGQVLDLEKEGKSNIPAHQILFELGWIIGNVRDEELIHSRFDALDQAIRDPANLSAVDRQSPETGAWGDWYSIWFFKLDATFEGVSKLASEGKVPRYQVRILDAINSPAKLKDHLDSILISERKRGIDHRRELNETLAALVRLILRGEPANYPYDPALKTAILDWIAKAQSPETGYWGEWYRNGDQIVKTNDLSITFHILSYLDGAVSHWPQIIDTTLAIKDKPYPHGWLEDGAYLNHNNMDVVRIFELGWPRANPEQKSRMRIEIQKMLDWCLEDSLQPDGSFALNASDDSVETSIYFGTTFLVRLGYFDKSRRFWTDQDFPNAAADRNHIIAYIRSHQSSGGEGGTYYRSALENLNAPGGR